MADVDDIAFFGVCAFLLLTLVGGCVHWHFYRGQYDKCRYYSTFYDLYYTDAPNGIYWVETEGAIGGNIIFIYGKMTSELQMSYTVQFFKGDEMSTRILEAQKVNVVFDGTFRLERINKVSQYRNNVGETWDSDIIRFHRWLIHLPVKPVNNRTITFVK